MGYVFEEHEVAQNLYGYGGDKRQQKANIIIRRKYVGSAANDVGFLRRDDGTYELIISEYDRVGTKKSAVDFTQKIKQIYAVSKVKKKAKSLGYTFMSQKQNQDGKIKVKVFRA